jgi:hypothetical protein
MTEPWTWQLIVGIIATGICGAVFSIKSGRIENVKQLGDLLWWGVTFIFGVLFIFFNQLYKVVGK